MQIVQAVFGVFHHFELAHQLHARKHLRRSTPPGRGRGSSAKACRANSSAPSRCSTPRTICSAARPLYPPRWMRASTSGTRCSFDRWLRAQDRTLRRIHRHLRCGPDRRAEVQAAGGKFICDRGSTHQRFQDEVLAEEYRRWNVPYSAPPAHIVRREEAIYAIADAITVPSTSRAVPSSRMGIAAEKVHVIPYGVRLDKFTPGEAPPLNPSRFSSPARSACAKASLICWKPSPACAIRTSA